MASLLIIALKSKHSKRPLKTMIGLNLLYTHYSEPRSSAQGASNGNPKRFWKTDRRGFTFFALFSILFPAGCPFALWKRRAPHDNESEDR